MIQRTPLIEDEAQEGIDFRSIFEALPGQYLILDRSFRIVAASDAYLAATMTRRDELVGRHVFDAFPDNPEDPDATGVTNLRRSLERVLRERRADTMAVQQYAIRRPAEEGGGFEQRHWSPINTPVLDGNGRVAFIVHRVEDVTEYVRLQQQGTEQAALTSELRHRMAEAESEILRRSAELQTANEELRVASRAKTDFLSRMSHELRTPLAAILGFSELLGLKDLGDDDRQMVGIINKAGNHLLDLINDVLDLSRIELGQVSMSPEPVPLQPIIDGAIDLMKPLAETRHVELVRPVVAGSGSYVIADQQRLKQVLINLISNGIKYNRPHGSVRLTVAPNGNRVYVIVEDTGMGIEAGDVDRLFVPFERLQAAADGIEGVGLGLALSRDLVVAMGGSLSLSSRRGAGTTVTLELLATEPAAIEEISAAEGLELAVRTYLHPRRLLYVEDTLANVRLVEAILERRPSVTLLPAMLGQLGIDLARELVPDLILLDLHLPDLDGDAVLTRLQADPATRDIPVVVLSADATGVPTERMLALGAKAYLTKPLSVRQLLEVLDTYLDS
ncbi:MAG: response regulator [Candidatus Dormibacteraeota bacterium]|nr:response regulator [Candidatus Dormibacteraeota bacterium]